MYFCLVYNVMALVYYTVCARTCGPVFFEEVEAVKRKDHVIKSAGSASSVWTVTLKKLP